MKIVFRVDASLEIGNGHVMRCLTLAEALRARGSECSFICRDHAGNLIDAIRRRGHAVHVLPVADSARRIALGDAGAGYARWLGAHWREDAQSVLTICAALHPDWLVVDHYALDARWEAVLRDACPHVLVIDDLADRPHDCDVLLDQTLGRLPGDYAGKVPPGCTVLAGAQFALLRPEFSRLRDYSLARRGREATLARVLVTMGGVDRPDATGRALEALALAPLPAGCRITVVMGAHAPWLERVKATAAGLGRPVEVCVDVSDMARIMADSDLAIGAAGSTAWERCCLGLPSLMVLLAANQEKATRALEAVGAAIGIGGVDQIESGVLSAMQRLSADPGLLAAIARRAALVTDGQGATGVIEALSSLST